jgi:hypothetical protein
MKRLLTSSITTTAGLPIQGATLDFLQNAPKEILEMMARNQVGRLYSTSSKYILEGCDDSIAGSVHTISNGWMLYNDTLYRVVGSAVTLGGGQVVLCNIVDQYLGGTDPVTFTDLSTHNVHQDKVITLSAGTTGTGSFDYSVALPINKPFNLSNTTANWVTSLQCRMTNGILHIDGTAGGLNASAAASGDTIITLPSWLQPQSTQYCVGTLTTANFDEICQVKFLTNGDIKVYKKSGAPTSLVNNSVDFSIALIV